MKNRDQKLLVSVRGPLEAMEAAEGGADIADVEYPASALGTPYPLNIRDVQNRLNDNGYDQVSVSTNIGEMQHDRATACQAAVGVATAGADIVKCGLAELPMEPAVYQGDSLVRSVQHWHSDVKVVPVVFVDEDLQRFFDPRRESVELATRVDADGILVDTFNKQVGKGLLDYWTIEEVKGFTEKLHDVGCEAWIAGSIGIEELQELWETGVDVICVRGAACEERTGTGRFGEVTQERVALLADTRP